VIAEVLPGCYDFEGRRISHPSKKRHPSFQGRPMGSFLSQPLKHQCRSLDEIRAFLSTCRYVSDQAQFGVRDYWMPPAEFQTLFYKPAISVEMSGSQVKFYEHDRHRPEPPFRTILPLIPDWSFWWLRIWLRAIGRLILWPYRTARRRFPKSGSAGPAT
jgi:hypothetical protein